MPSENARVENGVLVIEARRESFQGAEYTSASLTGRANWTYGRIEVRAKLPKDRGTWPAIWTLGTNIRQVGWPQCGEFDIMEHVGLDPGHSGLFIGTIRQGRGQRVAIGGLAVRALEDPGSRLGMPDERVPHDLHGDRHRTGRSDPMERLAEDRDPAVYFPLFRAATGDDFGCVKALASTPRMRA